MKKLFALLLAAMLVLSLAAVAGAEDEGKVLNIYCWNDEFKTRVEKFYTFPEGITSVARYEFHMSPYDTAV